MANSLNGKYLIKEETYREQNMKKKSIKVKQRPASGLAQYS
jgi:hypothetical protein